MTNITVVGNTAVLEYAIVSIVANVSGNANIDGNITSVSVVNGPYTTGTITTVSDNIITITGQHENVFPKSITYLDVNRQPQTISSFSDLPAKFDLLTNFTASQSNSAESEYYVYVITDRTANSQVGTITQTVINSYDAGQAALKAAVPKGLL